MPQTIRSILGKSNRVRKKPSARRSPLASGSRRGKERTPEDASEEQLSDRGTVSLLDDVSLRDVVQAMRYIRSRMFVPLPAGGGPSSTRRAEVMNYRLAMPPIVAAGQLDALLRPPSWVAREVADLGGRGVLRRIRVDRRGALGEALIESADYEAMLTPLSPRTAQAYKEFLREHPTAQTVGDELGRECADELLRAGLLTRKTRGEHDRPGGGEAAATARSVSRHASGTLGAVGGSNAVHAGGGGGGALTRGDMREEMRIAVPGHGTFLKLAEGSVGWVRETLGGRRWGEATEGSVRERFEGRGWYGTRWREFWGVEWEWVLGMAVGGGDVEVFETGSVGRGVRLRA